MMKKGIVFGTFLLLSTSLQAGMTICTKYSCQQMQSYDSQQVLNALAQSFAGKQKELVFCEADQYNKTCVSNAINFSGRTNLMSVQFQVPFVRILQVKPENGSVQLLLDYQIQANQYYPMCKPANTTLSFAVSNQGDFTLSSPGFKCRITELGETQMQVKFTFDYLDFDKGWLGGTYQFMSTGDVLAGGSGYAMLKMSQMREIVPPRSAPTDFVSDTGYRVSANKNGVYQGYSRQNSGLVDWDMDSIKTKWENFKTKFMKILYLEPLE